MAGNKFLHAANRAKQDEFYTQLSDIEKELKHYRKHFLRQDCLLQLRRSHHQQFLSLLWEVEFRETWTQKSDHNLLQKSADRDIQ